MEKRADLKHETLGLSSAEAEARKRAGRSNDAVDVKTRSVPKILSDNIFTFFNFINLVLAALVFITGEYRNMLFFQVVVLNIIINSVYEIRAKRMVDKLTLLTSSSYICYRDGREVSLPSEELVEGDVIKLAHGDQIPADARVFSGFALVDESIITGESDSCAKNAGDELFSGTHLLSGSLLAELTRVGKESYASRINIEAKREKKPNSEILSTTRAIINLASMILIPVGLLLFARNFFLQDAGLNEAILISVAAVVGMIPQGLILLTSGVFALATTRLAQEKVLVQQSYCLETLARVDLICLDKTGTITSGEMEVEELLPAPGNIEQDLLRAIAAVVYAAEDDLNATSRALTKFCDACSLEREAVAHFIPFSSEKKYSAVVLESGDSYVMGASEFILSEKDLRVAKELGAHLSELSRVLALCSGKPTVKGDGRGLDLSSAQLIGLVSLRDLIRNSAYDTLKYFDQEGVDVAVISGDNTSSVAAIAEHAGVVHADKSLDLSRVDSLANLGDSVDEYRIFGRVTPEQKRDLISAFQDAGHVVCMVGDGVNDVLALREADCSISMASATSAARNISELVLADDDFSHVPDIVAEGRRSINNLERSATLFLMKTLFSALLGVICLILPPYPFIPIQMTLISAAVIGIPSVVLSLESNYERIKGNFLSNVLLRALPASLAIELGLLLVLITGRVLGWEFSEISSASTIVCGVVGIALVIELARPLKGLHLALAVFISAILILGATLFANFFMFARLSTLELLAAIMYSLIAFCTFEFVLKFLAARHEKLELVSERFIQQGNDHD